MNKQINAQYQEFPLWNTFYQNVDKFLTNPDRYTPSRQVDTKSVTDLKEIIYKFKQLSEQKMSQSKQDFVLEFRISETDIDYEKMIHILLPNVFKDEVKIESYKNQLTVSFDKDDEETASFVPNSFTKTFTFGEEFDMDKIVTNMQYGVLNIAIPKKQIIEQKFETKKIHIN
jgi:HSP20 family molecular chaperone IbpA